MEHTFKRLLSLAVALFMVISMIPGSALPVFAAEETSTEEATTETTAAVETTVAEESDSEGSLPADWSTEYHCVCGDPNSTGNPCAEDGHKMQTWQPWTETRTVPFIAGYWYLPNDLDLSAASYYPYFTGFSTTSGIIGRNETVEASADSLTTEAVHVYVDLNGKTVTGEADHRIYRLEPGYAHSLTITDTVGTGKLVAQSNATNRNQGMVIWTRGSENKVTIYGGTLDGSGATVIPLANTETANGGSINNAGTIDIYGGTVIGGTVKGTIANGGAILNSGTLNIHGGTVTGGTADGTAANGATVYNQGTMNVNGGSIVGGSCINATNGRGGAIYNWKTLNIRGGIITGGTVNGTGYAQGGAIFNDNSATTNIYAGTINGGTVQNATAQGGNIRNQGKLNIYGGTISGGTATGTTVQGGNVSNVGTFYMEGGTITGGTANGTSGGGNGGAFFSTTGGTMKGGTIQGGVAHKNGSPASGATGGAVFIFGGTFTMDGGTILPASTTTVSAYQGATVYIRSTATFVLNKGVIAAGRVNDIGGGVALSSGATFTMNGGTVTGTYYADGTPVTDPADANASGVTKVTNSAGSAVGAWGGTINMTGGTIIGGKASNVGGSVAVRYGAVFNMSGGLITGGMGTGTGSTNGGGNVAVDYQVGKEPTFNMTGGTITGGTGTNPGVLVNRGGKMNISGNAVIKGNVDNSGKENNLALLDNNGSGASYGFVLGVGEMGANAEVGITMATPGVFTAAVSAANAAAFYGDAGHYVTQNEDGTLSLVAGHQGHCVCGGTTDRCDHTALEGEWKPWDGKSNISEGGNYYLTQSLSTNQWWMGGAYTNTTAMTINLCLNGHSITSSGRVFGVAPYVTFNLMNCNHGQSVLTGKNGGSQSGTIFMYATTGNMSMYGDIKVIGKSSTAPTEGGAMNVKGTFNMYGGEIVGQTVSATGGAIHVAGTFNMYDGKISGGTANGGNGGGNIYLAGGSTFNMYDGEIVGGTATAGHGGNIKLMTDSTCNIYGGEVRDGVVSLQEGKTGDPADKNGGNIAQVDQDSDDEVGGLTISGNTVISGGAANRGGNIFIHSGTFTVKDNVKILGGTEYGINQPGAPCVEINFSNTESTAANRTYVVISGTPEITDIRRSGTIDFTGLEAGAKIGVNRKGAGQVSSGALADDVASGIYSTNENYVIVNEDDAAYSVDPSTIHYHDKCVGTEAGNCDHSGIYYKTAVTDVTQIVAPGNYYLDADITDAAELTLTGSGVINLCLNGHTWAGATRTMVVPAGITLNISNCSDTEGVISGKGHPTESATSGTTLFGRVLFLNGGTVNVYSGVTLKAADNSNTGAYVNETESINWQRQGGVISTVGGALNIYGATLDGNSQAATTGGTIRSQSGTVITIVGGVLKNGKATNGGAIMINSGDKLTVTGTSFEGNYAGGKGAAAYNLDATMTIDGATFADNTIASNGLGGLIYSNGVTTTLKNMQMPGLTVAKGGVLYVQKGTVNLESVTMSGGRAADGSGIYLENGTLNIDENTVIEDCVSTNSSGAINMVNGTVNFAGTIRNCSAKYGGAMNMSAGTFNMNGGLVTGCTATGSGGGSFMINNSSVFNLNDGIIENGTNTRKVLVNGAYNDVYGGGNIMIWKATVYIKGGIVRGGNAGFGGNISVTDGGQLIMTGGTVTGGTAVNGHGGNIAVRPQSSATITGGTISDGTTLGSDHNGGNISLVDNNNTDPIGFVTIGGNTVITGGSSESFGDSVWVYAGILTIEGNADIGAATTDKDGCVTMNNTFLQYNTGSKLIIKGQPKIAELFLKAQNTEDLSVIDISELTSAAEINLTMGKPGVFSSAAVTADNIAGITCLNSGYHINLNADSYAQMEAHDYVGANCQADGTCSCGAVGGIGKHILTYTAAVEATCHQNGMQEYWYCEVCDIFFADEAATQQTNAKNLVIVATVGLTHVDAVEATCHQNGCAEYWYCTECEAVFADAAGTVLTNRMNLTIPATVGLTHVDAVEATCHQNGCAEYWYCAECEAVFADAAGTVLTNRLNLTVPATVGLTHVEAEEAGCHQNGHAEYWYCAECEAVFADAAGTQLTNIKNLTIAATPLTHVEAVEVGCHQNGMQEYWYCETCDAVFADAAGVQLTNRMNLVIAADPLTHVEAVEVGCHQNGMQEYWYCETCEAVFADAAGTVLTNRMNLVVAATPLTHVEAVEVGCHQNGCAEYWYCETCEAVFADAAGTVLTNRMNLVIAADPLTHVEAVEVGCHQNGCAEYWYCETCEAVFADAAGTVLTNRMNLVIAAEPLTYVAAVEATCHQNGCAEYWYCETCEAVFADAAGTVLTNRMNLVIPATVGLTHVEAVEAGLHTPGSQEYWYCTECDAVFADAAGTVLTNRKNLVIVAEHELAYEEAVEATCHQPGLAEYWYCATCDAYFADANGIQLTNLKNLVTEEATPLTYVAAVEPTFESNGCQEYWYCETCEAVFADAQGTVLTNRMNLTIPALVAVAQIGDEKFETLAEAVAAAEPGETVTLLQNIVLTEAVHVYNEVIIDLNGMTVSANTESWNADHQSLLYVRRGGKLTVNDTVGTGLLDATHSDLRSAICLTYVDDESTGDLAELIVNGGTLKGYWYAVTGNGMRDNTAITINGGELIGVKYDGLYHPQNGTLTITGGTLSGNYCGVYLRSGSLTITGGTIIGTNDSALAIRSEVHSDDPSGYQAIGEVSVTGGNFINNSTYPIVFVKVVEGAAEVDGFISGGSFSEILAEEHCAEGYIPTVVADENGMYTVEEKGDNVAQNQATGTLYETVAEALQAAEDTGATVKMVADSSEYSIVIPDGVTLDLNGKTLTASYVNAFGPVTGDGLLKSVQGKTNLFAQDGYMPVWNGEGYIFITDIALSADTNVKVETTDAGLEFSFLPVLNAEMRELMADGGSDNGVKLVVRMTWTLSDGNLIQEPYDVTFDDAFLQKVYSSETAQWCFVLNVKNAANLDGLTFQIVLVSDTGAELVSQTVNG